MTVSDADLAAAVRADLVAMMSLLHAPPIGDVEVGADAIWVRDLGSLSLSRTGSCTP